jgi:ribonuclease R
MSGARAKLSKLLEELDLEERFPEAVEAEAAAWLAQPGIDDPELVDLTSLPFVTIDQETSKDLDQAAFVARENGGFDVCYALADAAYYVPRGSAIFGEALRRGASYYLPDVMVPMLPRSLSEGLVSLNPNVERRAMVFRMHVDEDGACTSTTILRARVRSRHKLSFRRVQAFYDDPKGHPFEPDVAASLSAIWEVGKLRMGDARERDVLPYRRTEVAVGVEGMRFVAAAAVREDVEKANEQLSLLCNVEGARSLRSRLGDARVQPIFRVHPSPGREEMEALRARLGKIAASHGLQGRDWDPGAGESLSSYLDALPETGVNARVALAIHRQAMLVNGRSSFRSEPGAHFGVGADVYARFSAPMREIVGVFVHGETWEGLGAPGVPGPPQEEDALLREEVLVAANRAKDLQHGLTNRANELVLDQLFDEDRRARRERLGTVTGMASNRVYVALDDPPIDVKVYLAHLTEQLGGSLRIDPDGIALLRGKKAVLRAGDAVRVRVVERDARRKRWNLALTRVSSADGVGR